MLLDRSAGRAVLRSQLRLQLRIPVVVAPMFLVSCPQLVVAACRSGVIGGFPTLNARSTQVLADWLDQIARDTEGGAPHAANMILDKSNKRFDADFELVRERRVPIVIASVGKPDRIVEPVHAYGGIVFADVATLRHARNAAAAGADGLVLLTTGAGGNTGWQNPFAFVAAVREFFDGPLAVAGCVSHGHELRALEILGADLGYMGTAFLASSESEAPPEHKQAILDADIDSIVLSDALSGMKANFIRNRLHDAGHIAADGSVRQTGTIDVASWKEVLSAGQGVGCVHAIEPTTLIVDRLEREYKATGR
jgi:nitronate monooxygenase